MKAKRQDEAAYCSLPSRHKMTYDQLGSNSVPFSKDTTRNELALVSSPILALSLFKKEMCHLVDENWPLAIYFRPFRKRPHTEGITSLGSE